MAATAVWLPSLRRERDDWRQILGSLATLHLRGVDVDWKAFDGGYPRQKPPLPSYPFERRRYWIEDGLGPKPEGRPLDGVSLRSLLTEGEPMGPRRLFWNGQAMRDGGLMAAIADDQN